jgi:hypothetical protein
MDEIFIEVALRRKPIKGYRYKRIPPLTALWEELTELTRKLKGQKCPKFLNLVRTPQIDQNSSENLCWQLIELMEETQIVMQLIQIAI